MGVGDQIFHIFSAPCWVYQWLYYLWSCLLLNNSQPRHIFPSNRFFSPHLYYHVFYPAKYVPHTTFSSSNLFQLVRISYWPRLMFSPTILINCVGTSYMFFAINTMTSASWVLLTLTLITLINISTFSKDSWNMTSKYKLNGNEFLLSRAMWLS